jgi:hypothetical protein
MHNISAPDVFAVNYLEKDDIVQTFFFSFKLIVSILAGEMLMILLCLSKERTCGNGKENCKREKKD